jgi:hypothetical protein
MDTKHLLRDFSKSIDLTKPGHIVEILIDGKPHSAKFHDCTNFAKVDCDCPTGTCRYKEFGYNPEVELLHADGKAQGYSQCVEKCLKLYGENPLISVADLISKL